MRTLSNLSLLHRTKIRQLLSIILLLTMMGNMFLLPGAAQAQPQAVSPAVASVVAGGERFMDAAPQALGRALQLAQRLDYISQVELADLSETTLIQARQDALATAQQAATAQGAVGAIATGLDELDYEVQAAADMATEVADLNSTGFDPELETALADLGLSSGQISSLEDEAAANFTVRGSPLPTETVTLLQEAGLTSAEIDQVEQTLTDYGLADDALSDRLAQFRASQQEMSLVRTEALVAYLQLLTKQVFVRQLAGEASRELISTEVDEVVQDQLRLLIHLGYLDSLGNPDSDVGEGQWLFIERYSLRVAERLDALILDTQNVGLVVDLLVALQIHSTALAALAGDAQYAKNEVDPLADFLATMLGDNLPGSLGYRQAAPPLWWEPALAMGDYNPALLANYEPALAPEAVTVAQEQAQGRIKGLAYPLWFQDPDPSNNWGEIIFQTAPPTLPPGVLEILNQVMGSSTPLEFIWEVLTGQSENWWAIGGNIVLSFVPIAGEILDLISLFTEPSLLGKAFALIGLVASLLSDGTEILTAVGIVVPPALAALPAAVGAEAIDVGAAILKNVRRLVTADVYNIIKNIPFDDALRLGGDLLGHLAKRAVDAAGGVNNWPGSLDEVFSLIQNVLGSVWEPFVALVKHYGSAGLSKLFTLGFGDGGLLAGRVLKQGGEFNDVDKVVEGVAKIGDDLAKAGVDLSDEAAQGMGHAIDTLDYHKTKQIFSECLVNLASKTDNQLKIAGLASPLRGINELCERSLRVYRQLSAQDPSVKRAIEKIANSPFILDLDTFLDDVGAGVLSIDIARDVLQIVDEVPHDLLNGNALDPMANLLTTGRLDKEALKHFPFKSVDDVYGIFYPELDAFLVNSSYINRNGNLSGQAVEHIGNVLGEYRERRYLRRSVFGEGRTRIFTHLDPPNQNITDPLTQGFLEVNHPSRLDAITQKGDTFFIGEAKDGGIRHGTILDGPSGGSKVGLKPTDFALIRMPKQGVFELNVEVFLNELNKLVSAGDITVPQQDAIEAAARNGKLELDIFIGGEHIDVLSNGSLRSIGIYGIANPLYPEKRIKINLIPD